jgi:hypothetical protein
MVRSIDQFDAAACFDRLAGHLRECSRRYPNAWRLIDKMRADRQQFGDWPAWCFCPSAAAQAIVAQQHRLETRHLAGSEVMLDIGRITSLAAWRVSQGVYWIDPTVRDAVMETPALGAVPVDVLMALPQWCLYVPTPGFRVERDQMDCAGFFASLSYDVDEGFTELRIEMDLSPHDGATVDVFEALSPDILHLHRGLTFDENYDAMLAAMRRRYEQQSESGRWAIAQQRYLDAERAVRATAHERTGPILSLLLYLCSQTAEYRAAGELHPGRPGNPEPKRIKTGWRLFPPDRPRIWHVGEQIGQAIRTAQARNDGRDGERAGPRPHVRRAHWHSFWTGTRTDPTSRKIVLKWLPPIPVAMEEDTPAARMRRDQPKPLKSLDADVATLTAELEARHGGSGPANPV